MRNYKKILLATMSFDIGGVETHVLELASGLKNLGYIPIIVSNGGVYVSELKLRGIQHIRLPLHNKNPKNILDSYFLLKKIIEKEQIDIVHAHARIPAFTLGILQKYMNFRFVTTVHGLFNTSPIYRFNSNWGEASIAVSDDLKSYLIENYNIKPENILVTINGISNETFKKEIDTKDIQKKYSIDNTKTIIAHISRLEPQTSLVAHQLINISKNLYKQKPDTRILIVGGGKEFEHIKTRAAKINKDLGIEHIILTGATTKVNKFLAISDICIGVSRVALEAMCTKCPTILAGNAGYIGIFDKEKLSLAVSSNFTCRGELGSTSKALLKDIITLITMPDRQKKDLGEYGHKFVKENYSVEKMTLDNVALYDKVWKT
ncbi:hypothetical protein AN641_02040 [Candidatus Epulonipiscioides gigas]|nr:hypothetical protein AN641_02040 [Epulopiscium sp. SCG-C07WGA-EpuloA2]